jgi:hypothetical protein
MRRLVSEALLQFLIGRSKTSVIEGCALEQIGVDGSRGKWEQNPVEKHSPCASKGKTKNRP